MLGFRDVFIENLIISGFFVDGRGFLFSFAVTLVGGFFEKTVSKRMGGKHHGMNPTVVEVKEIPLVKN